MDVLAEAAEPGLVIFQRLFAPACGPVEVHRVRGRLPPRVRYEHPAGDVLEPGDPELTIEPAGEPAGHADVIRMHVGADHPSDGTTAQGTRERGLPCCGGLGRLHSGIDD